MIPGSFHGTRTSGVASLPAIAAKALAMPS